MAEQQEAQEELVQSPQSALEQLAQDAGVVDGQASEASPEEVDAAKVQADLSPSDDEELIRIGDKVFSSEKEALAYVQAEQARDSAVNEAYRQALLDAQLVKDQVTPEETSEEDDFDSKFYENPKEYLKQVQAQAVEQAKLEIQKQQQAQQQEQAAWEGFYKEYPDLETKDKLVKLIVKENWDDIKSLPLESAYKVLALKTRKQLKEWADADKPSEHLQRTAQSASPGSQTGVTPAPVKEEKLDMISQLTKLQNKRM